MNITSPSRIPWNRGVYVGQKRPLKPQHLWSIRARLQMDNNPRNLALFNLAIDSKLRGVDLLKLRVRDIAANRVVGSRATVIQQKTGKPVQFEITETTKDSVTEWLRISGVSGSQYLFPSRNRSSQHLSTRQYARIVNGWIKAIGLDDREYGTHSLRRTKASLIYKRTGNLRAVQLLLGHTKLDSTIRYLGVEVEDALELSERTEI